MIEWLARRIFGWAPLREHIFQEVHFYDYLDNIINDPEEMKTAASFYPDADGYRAWSQNPDTGKYYFNDIPEANFVDAASELEKMESHD
jgi:hypothetical protein